jgi:hypothetical protein
MDCPQWTGNQQSKFLIKSVKKSMNHVYAQYHAVMDILSSESDKGLWDTSSLDFIVVGNQTIGVNKISQPKTE